VSSNDGSCDAGMVGWLISSMNSLNVSSKEDCLDIHMMKVWKIGCRTADN
jgi:hypothetical protein